MTVSLWIRETVGGRRSYRKPNKKKVYPEGTVFCLRYSIEGKRRWETLRVTNLSAALTARARKEAALLSDAPSIAPAPAKRINVDDAISNYLTTVAATLAHKTWLAYSLALTEFRKACTKECLDQIDRSDLIALVVAQKNDGQDDRTVANRIAGVVTFLRAQGIMNVTLRPKYTEKKVKAYSVEEIRALNAASTDEELQIWQFFLGTGFREDEVSHACDTDVDFKLKTISVLEKRQWKWKPKDKEERTVPIPDSLVELLKVRKAMHPVGWLIFPNTEGNPQGHFLRMLKERAFAAGLNCGHCTGKLDGKTVSCKDVACCEHWILHRFRKTFATMHHANGVPARTIQLWLGHESLETTLRYLADAELGSEKTRTQVAVVHVALCSGLECEFCGINVGGGSSVFTGFLDHPAYTRPADRMLACHLRERHAGAPIMHDLLTVNVEPSTTDLATFEPCPPHASPHSFPLPKLPSGAAEVARKRLNTFLDAVWADDPVLAVHVMTPSGEFVSSFARAINGVREKQIAAGLLRTFVAWNGPRHTSPAEARLAAQTLLQASLEGNEDAADTGIEFVVFVLMRARDSDDKLVWLQTVFGDQSLDVVFGLLEQAAQKSTRLSHWFSQLFARILPANPDRATSILIQMMQSDSYETSQTAAGLFANVAAARPQQLMDGIGAAVLSKEKSLKFLFRKFPITLLPEGVVIQWLEKHGLEGARLLARHVPGPFIGSNGPELNPVTRLILESYGNDDIVFSSWFAGMHSGGAFAGSIADHMEQRATRAEPFLNFPVEAVRRWAMIEINYAAENAENFRMSEEEMF